MVVYAAFQWTSWVAFKYLFGQMQITLSLALNHEQMDQRLEKVQDT